MVSYTDPTDEIAGMLGEVSVRPAQCAGVAATRQQISGSPSSPWFPPILRLQGEGVVTPEADKSWFNRPLKLTLSLE